MIKDILIFILFNFSFIFIYPREYVEESFFGLHINNFFKKENVIERKILSQINFRTWRLWDSGICWPEIQPKDGKSFNFDTLDKYVALSEEYSKDLIINLGLTPKWAAKRPLDKSGYGENLTATEPNNIEDWKKYVREVATRYKGKIRYYEIWNEPDMRLFFTGRVEELVKLTKEAYKILKDVDKNNVIISPPVTGYLVMLPWLNSFFKKGGKDYIDVIGTHYYLWFKNDIPEDFIKFIKTIDRYKSLNKIESLPVWNTECGFRQKNVSNTLGAAYLARLSVIQWYYGVDRIVFYSLNNKFIINMLDKNKREELNEVGKSFFEIQKWMINSKVELIKNDRKNVYSAYLINRNGSRAIMFWLGINNTKKQMVYKIEDKELYKYKKIKGLLSEENNLSDNKIILSAVPVLIYQEDFFYK